jgi:CheY-like chemotaxis protein
VALAEVLTDFTTMLNLQAQEKGLRLTVTPEGPLPDRIQTDPLRLRQILINIVGNALKFTRRGSVDVTIKLIPGSEGAAKLEFAVTDTGPGVAPENAAKLFEPFTQADASTKRIFGGTGLGLVLSRRLANRLGGDVVLTHSEPGKGSTFTITIDPGPIVTPAHSHESLTTSPAFAAPAVDGVVRIDGLLVLVVDDAADNQMLVGRYLKRAGAQVDTAGNGREAIDKARRKAYDVLLMDLQMPIMDGYEATAALREGGYAKPIVALTAHALKEERRRCLSSGFDDHVGKPVNRGALLESIAQLCGSGPKMDNENFEKRQ